MKKKRREAFHKLLAGEDVSFISHPTRRPLMESAPIGGQWRPGRIGVRAMLITTLLNRCHHFPGFVYEQARLADEGDSILIPIRPRKGTPAICSGCHHPAG